jgi:hypothetical protein
MIPKLVLTHPSPRTHEGPSPRSKEETGVTKDAEAQLNYQLALSCQPQLAFLAWHCAVNHIAKNCITQHQRTEISAFSLAFWYSGGRRDQLPSLF